MVISDDAMVLSPQIAQDLQMCAAFLGIDALVADDEDGDLLDPKIGLPCSESRNPHFPGKMLIIQPSDMAAKEFYILVEKSRINERTFALFTVSHELYIRRRKSDINEVQQVKIRAKTGCELKELH
ncbi:unnamed protein product [Hydatigera taeniaeformis]|uniref:Anoctamin-8 n=1 Tax=Hydatigena taeniaeformis TaxID=6205 RepID=A0A0R3WU91_HYDTA|nr:unnamed protein product [Hydatigera taeniaeformis]